MIYKSYDEQMKQVPYKRAGDIRKEVIAAAKLDEFVGTKAEHEAEEARVNELAKATARKADAEYHQAQEAVKMAFAQALSEEYGTGVQEVDGAVWTLAWANGHSGGFHDVEGQYSEIMEVAEVAYNAGLAGKK